MDFYIIDFYQSSRYRKTYFYRKPTQPELRLPKGHLLAVIVDTRPTEEAAIKCCNTLNR